MDSTPNVRLGSPWFGIGIFLLVVVLAIVFFALASGRLGHRWHNGNRLDQPATTPAEPLHRVGP